MSHYQFYSRPTGMNTTTLRAWGPAFAGFVGAVVLSALLLALSGCSSPKSADDPAGNAVESLPNAGPAGPGSGGSAAPGGSTTSQNANPGIMPMGGGVAAPVTNPSAVEGAGSAAGSVAKDRARDVAGRASQAPQMPSEDN